MSANLIAKATITIQAAPEAVWDALTNPDKIKQYMFGADVTSDWKVGSPIVWKGEFQGKKYEDKGVIEEFTPNRKLAYSHFSPLSGKPDKPESYHKVTITIDTKGEASDVTLTQDKNDTESEREKSQGNWASMLKGLEKTIERKA
jgi:uncharacterized protein YndB with AHSA1/START domain